MSKCKTCKKQPETVHSLTTIDLDDLKQAFEYVSIATQMNTEKWNFVEGVYKELYPGKKPLNRQCSSCLSAAAKAIEYEYKNRWR